MKSDKTYYYISKQKHKVGSHVFDIVYESTGAAALSFLRNNSGNCYLHTLKREGARGYEVTSVVEEKIFV